jgi:hypothetical protein
LGSLEVEEELEDGRFAGERSGVGEGDDDLGELRGVEGSGEAGQDLGEVLDYRKE